MRLFGKITAAAVLLALLPVPVVHAHEATPVCPKVAIVAARGSEQNEEIQPTTYSEAAPQEFSSTGFEGPNIRGLLQHAESRYSQAHPMASLLKNVDVIDLNDDIYPAELYLPAIAEKGEEVSFAEAAQRLIGIVSKQAPDRIIYTAVTGLVEGMKHAKTAVPRYISDYEQHTNCRPSYILVGFSQGALLLSNLEKFFAATGRLAGVVYIGNPLLEKNHHHGLVIGGPESGTGLLGVVGERIRGKLSFAKDVNYADVPRINVCQRADFACDTTIHSLSTSARSRGGIHNSYFQEETKTPEEDLAADELAKLITSQR
ncbi:MAG: hypothetical protein Q4D85_05480 [Corynebacterium sp.]|uniref:hypothetical protein n=1 Tax=Corynebacterium sp. TaxID=1720 RepID=UPI0026DB7B51|nr:hypothetical protein [Corynebacterium sp.]MDO5098193.1 hypothetical protein [Corynebacterium sp.]